jgi:hypothetical protein
MNDAQRGSIGEGGHSLIIHSTWCRMPAFANTMLAAFGVMGTSASNQRFARPPCERGPTKFYLALSHFQ